MPREADLNVLDVFERIRRAMLSGRADEIREHVAEDYRGSDAGGQLHDRDLMLHLYGPGGIDLEVFDAPEVQVKNLGDTALLSGIASIRGEYHGVRFAHELRFLDVYVRRDSAWQLIASHVTDLRSV